jgi:hypothetical protein
MLHFAVSLGDAMDELSHGRALAAFKALVNRTNAASLGAVVQNAQSMSRLGRVG